MAFTIIPFMGLQLFYRYDILAPWFLDLILAVFSQRLSPYAVHIFSPRIELRLFTTFSPQF